MIVYKPYCITQENYLDRLMLIQRYLLLLNKYFSNILALASSELKDTYISGQSSKFKTDLIKLQTAIDNVTIEELLNFFLSCNS